VTTRILLARHGLSTYNLEGRIQGRDDRSLLSPGGEQQARQLGEALREVPLTALWCSPLQRARRTAELLLEARGAGPALRASDRLLEIDLEPWTGLGREELRQRHPAEAQLWAHQPEELELQRPDGRSYRPLLELHQQARDLWGELLECHPPEEDHSVLVVAHNGILRCLLLAALELPAAAFVRYRLDNAALSVLNVRPGGDRGPQVQIESLNAQGHLGAPLPRFRSGRRLLLVRHGETHWNREGRFQGQIDIPLNERGRAQAAAAGTFLAGETLNRAYTSSMARPRQTAEAILAHQPKPVQLTSVDGLVEIAHGDWEGCLEEDIRRRWPELLFDWQTAPERVQMPGGETIQQVWDRSVDSWQRIAEGLDPGETGLVVAHDAVNKTILCHLLGLGAADIWAVKQGNGGVSVIDYGPEAGGTPVVACLNLTGHLSGVLDRTAAGAL
jgi:probable phosphoglycerate mutase